MFIMASTLIQAINACKHITPEQIVSDSVIIAEKLENIKKEQETDKTEGGK